MKVLTYLPGGLIVLPTETMDSRDSDKEWTLDQKHGHHLGLQEMPNLRPLPRSTESKTLGAGLRNPHFIMPSTWSRCLLTANV